MPIICSHWKRVFLIGNNGTGEPLMLQYEQIISGKESSSTDQLSALGFYKVDGLLFINH